MEKRSLTAKIFNVVNIALLITFGISTLYPFLNILAISFNQGMDAALGGVTIFPRKFSLFNYQVVFEGGSVIHAFFFSLIMTIVRTMVVLFTSSAAAYALNNKDLIYKKTILTFFLVPMFISSGLIPYFLVIKSVGLMNNPLVYILPFAFDFFSVLVLRVFFKSNIHDSLIESANMDGASDFGVYFRIILPLSKPILAALGLFAGVGAWNDWFTTLLFASNSEKLWTLQYILQKLVIQVETAKNMAQFAAGQHRNVLDTDMFTPQTIQYATLMIATLPIMLVYPFLQKYFVSGMMLGAVKE